MSMYSPLRIRLANLAGTAGKASPRMNGEWFPSHLICLIAELYESLCFVRTLVLPSPNLQRTLATAVA